MVDKAMDIWPYSVVQLSAPHLEHRLRRTIQAIYYLLQSADQRVSRRFPTASRHLSLGPTFVSRIFQATSFHVQLRKARGTVLPLQSVLSSVIYPDGFIWPLINSPLLPVPYTPQTMWTRYQTQYPCIKVFPLLSDPLSPSSLPLYIMHLRMYLNHCTASACALHLPSRLFTLL